MEETKGYVNREELDNDAYTTEDRTPQLWPTVIKRKERPSIARSSDVFTKSTKI